MTARAAHKRAIPQPVSPWIKSEVVAHGEGKNQNDKAKPGVTEPGELVVEVASRAKECIDIPEDEFENQHADQACEGDLPVRPFARRRGSLRQPGLNLALGSDIPETQIRSAAADENVPTARAGIQIRETFGLDQRELREFC